MLKQTFLLFTAGMLLAACSQRSPANLEVNMDDLDIGELQISPETMDDIIENIASPIEVAALISGLNVPYSSRYLADPESLSSGASSFEMAFSLGALSADLGYLNMYGKTGTALNILSCINRLAGALQLGRYFDLAIFNHLAATGSDPDSLMFISVDSFNKMEASLREDGQSSLGALMLTGVWIEGLYLATQVAEENSDEDLRLMIGEQKLILSDLLLILNNYKGDEAISRYISDLESIKSVYAGVKITYEVGQPQTVEKDDTLMVVQSESSHVNMSDETLYKIIEITEQIRNMHLNIKA